MKKVVLILFIFSFIRSFSQKENSDLKTVSNNMLAQVLAWNNGNINGFMEYYWNSDSLMFIGSKGVTYGWQKTHDNYQKNYPNKEAMGILKFTIVKREQLSKTNIFIIGKWELEKEKSVGGYFTLLWKKINSKWVIVADHTS